MRHTEKSTQVELSLASASVGGARWATITVRDHGQGVPESAIEDLSAFLSAVIQHPCDIGRPTPIEAVQTEIEKRGRVVTMLDGDGAMRQVLSTGLGYRF